MFLIFAYLQISLTQEVVNLILGKTYQGNIPPQSYQYNLYTFTIPQQANGIDLYFYVNNYHSMADPYIFVAQNTSGPIFPINNSNADTLNCTVKTMGDTCILSNQTVSVGNEYYITIYSRYPTKYSILIYQKGRKYMDLGNLFIVLILLGIFILGYAFRDKISQQFSNNQSQLQPLSTNEVEMNQTDFQK